MAKSREINIKIKRRRDKRVSASINLSGWTPGDISYLSHEFRCSKSSIARDIGDILFDELVGAYKPRDD